MSFENNYFQEALKDPYFIDYSALRRNQEMTYPHPNRLREFAETECVQEGDVCWTYGGNWYRGWMTRESTQLPLLIHKVNKHWRHGDEFYDFPDIVVAGCSLTAGFGLSHTFAWPKIIEHITKEKINNISLTGSPASKIVYNIFDHLGKVAKPKAIYLLLPELSRSWHFHLDKSPDGAGQNVWSYDHAIKSYATRQIKNKDGRLKSINNEKYEICLDMTVSNNLLHLELLAMHCEANDINLKIFSWDKMTHIALQNQMKFPHYCEIPNHLKTLTAESEHPKQHELLRWSFPREILKMGGQSCCSFTPQSFWQDKMWETALDVHPKHPHPHPGFHTQIHLAEIFMQRPIDVSEWADIKAWHEGTKYEPAS